MARVVITRQLPDAVMEAFRAAPEIGEIYVNPSDSPMPRDELIEKVKWCDALVSQLVDRIDEEVLEAGKNLKLVAQYAVGFNNIDINAAKSRSITVSNTPGVLTDATADLTFSLLLSVARRIPEADSYMRSGRFAHSNWGPLLLNGSPVWGRTLGIVGLGRVGYAVALRGGGFNMKILYYDELENPHAGDIKATKVPLEALLQQSDYVCLHCPLTPQTRHLIGEKELEMMKPTAYLINVARGPVVNEAALVQALQAKKIAGAALDVYEKEPEMQEGLEKCTNAVLVPHLGSSTLETRNKMGFMCLDNVRAVLAGKSAVTPVF